MVFSTRVLVVENEPPLRSRLTTYLVDVGFNTWATDNAEEAIQIIAKEALDVAIIDLHVSLHDGTRLILDAHELQPSLKFLLQTARTDYRLPSSLRKLGLRAADVFHKPLGNPEPVVKAIRRLTADRVKA